MLNEGSISRTGHVKWAIAAAAIITLPGLAIMVGMVSFVQLKTRLITILFFFIRCSRIKDQEAGASWPGGFSLSLLILQWLPRRELNKCFFLVSPFSSGYEVLAKNGRGLIRLRHMKSYDGLLQSSFMFFMQLVVLVTRPPVGMAYGMENGRCKFEKI